MRRNLPKEPLILWQHPLRPIALGGREAALALDGVPVRVVPQAFQDGESGGDFLSGRQLAGFGLVAGRDVEQEAGVAETLRQGAAVARQDGDAVE
jgi:hypothetical protein